ncbi:MAG: hypothetical protein LBQ74_09870 [Prevotella sp.]|jgi:hypothetical protein|nr:hypothetical protein [Prevotella sp.]
MKEICSVFDIIPLEDVAFAGKTDIQPLPGRFFDKLSASKLDLSMDKDPTDSGVVLSLKRDIVIDKVPDTVASRYSYVRTCVMVVYFTDGSSSVYGTPEYPIQAYIVRDLQHDILSIELKTTVFPIL